MKEIDSKKTKYFVIAIVILIILGILLIIHFNNKEVVSGDVEEPTTTTTTTTTTTKKAKVTKKEEVVEVPVVEEVVYKSTIDEKNSIVYNYKLTDEILESDKMVSNKLEIPDGLGGNNLIGLYDISLYDQTGIKKTVVNSLINIKIPLKDELLGYDEYKVVYINDKNEITDEKFEVKVENNYVEFNTTHLSMFGIVGIKKEVIVDKIEVIDLTNVNISLSVNDVVLTDTRNILLDRDDSLKVKVLNAENITAEYQVYYALKTENAVTEYKLLDDTFINSFENTNKYTLLIKVVFGEESKVFEVGSISVYDIVFVYNKEEVIKSDEYGVIYTDAEETEVYKNEDGSDYLYDNPDINKDIVIDSVIKEEIVEEETTSTNPLKESETTVLEDGTGEETGATEEPSVTIKVNGNIYLVEETDISDLELTGYLVIDTKEDITFDYDGNKLLTSNLYTITIRSKEFMLNGEKYTYEYSNDKLIIKWYEKVEDSEELKETDVSETFSGLFNDLEVNTNENKELVIKNNNLLNKSEEDNKVVDQDEQQQENQEDAITK